MSQGLSFTDLVEEAQRKSLKDLPPAIPSDKTTGGSTPEKPAPSASIKPKKTIFERYDTYITCPSCGALVPKGTKQCECGYDLSGPAAKLVRRLLRSAPVLLCIVLFFAGISLGFFVGQKQMQPQLQENYNFGYTEGYNAGTAVGHSDGYKDGLHDGLTAAANSQSKSEIPMPQLGNGKLVPIE